MKIPCSYGMTWRPTKSRSPPVKEKKGSNIKKTLKVWKKGGKDPIGETTHLIFYYFYFKGIIKKQTKKTKRKVIERREWVPYVHQLWTWDDTIRNEEPWPDGMRNNKRRASSYRSSQAIIELFFFPLFLRDTLNIEGYVPSIGIHLTRPRFSREKYAHGLIGRSSSLLK